MGLEMEILWSVLCSLGVLFFLLPIALMICAIKSKSCKESRLSSAEMGQISVIEPQDPPEIMTSASERKSTESHTTQKGKSTPMPVKKAIRQLPPLPEQQKSSVRRHSSYTGSTIYDTVKEVHDHFPPEDSKTPQQQTAEGSSFLEKVDENEGEVAFPIYAQVNKKVRLDHSIRPLSLYANVNKIDSQEVKSELFCNV